MPRANLVQCGHCQRFIEIDERRCPFCDAERRLVSWTSKLAMSAFAGLALVAIPGCPEEEDCATVTADEHVAQGASGGANGLGADCPDETEEEGANDFGEGGSDYAGPPIFSFA